MFVDVNTAGKEISVFSVKTKSAKKRGKYRYAGEMWSELEPCNGSCKTPFTSKRGRVRLMIFLFFIFWSGWILTFRVGFGLNFDSFLIRF